MKALGLVLLLSGSILACQKTAPGPLQTIVLSYKQPTTLPAGGAARATLTELNDSRCPTDAVCIWAGTIAATVEFTEGSTTQTARLGYQKNYGGDSAAVVLAGQNYWLRLLDVNPYPTTTNANLPRTATFRLRPR
jgi:hypothetical protein